METDDLDILNNLLRDRKLSMVPAGDHDDEYILSYAKEHRGFVVSNDLFHDHIRNLGATSSSEHVENMRQWIVDKRSGFLFIGDELVLNPSSSLSQHIAVAAGLTIDNITSEIELCGCMQESRDKYARLIELLLLRAHVYTETGQRERAWYDLTAVLSIDAECAVAARSLSLLMLNNASSS